MSTAEARRGIDGLVLPRRPPRHRIWIKPSGADNQSETDVETNEEIEVRCVYEYKVLLFEIREGMLHSHYETHTHINQ